MTQPAEAPVATSSFAYEPPPAPDQSEHDQFSQLLKDSVSEIENEFNPPPEFEEVPAEEPTEVAPETPTEPQDDPAVARGMDRLVQREVALQTKEAAIQAREAKVSALEAEVASLKAKLPAGDLQDGLMFSPTETLTKLGHDPRAVVRMLIAEQLQAEGKEVPAELKLFVSQAAERKRQAATDRELAALRSQIESRDQQAHAAAFFNTVQLGAREYVSKQVGEKDYPTLAVIAKQNPDRAHREIMEEITADARNRAATDPNGEPLTYAEAAKRVEARLSDYVALVKMNAGTTQAPASTARSPLQPTKAPAKPLKPWERDGTDIYKQGVDEAMREFHRLEQARKAQRK